MTWSIIARDPKTGALGVAVTSFFFAVGAIIPHIRPGVGAVATQAMVNRAFGPRGLDLLAQNHSPEQAVQALADSDPGHAVRQVHVMDAHGDCTAFTGESCPNWAGHRGQANVSVAGNTLAGPAVVEETLQAFLERTDLPFERRFIAALAAGEAAGGDQRGRQSAALLIRGRPDAPDIDIRSDDHSEPIEELERLMTVYEMDFLPVGALFPLPNAVPVCPDPRALTDAREKRKQNRNARLSQSQATVKT